MSDELDWGDEDEELEPVISVFPVSGRYHVELCDDPDCTKDHVDVKVGMG